MLQRNAEEDLASLAAAHLDGQGADAHYAEMARAAMAVGMDVRYSSQTADQNPRAWLVTAKLRTETSFAMNTDVQQPTIDLRTLPLGLAAWLGSIAGLLLKLSELGWLMVAASAMTTLVALTFRRGRRILIATGLVFVFAGGLACGRQLVMAQSLVGKAAASKGIVDVEVRINSDPVSYAAKGFLPARVMVPAEARHVEYRGLQSEGRTPVQLTASGDLGEQLRQLPAGSIVRLTARASPAKPGKQSAALLTVSSMPVLVRGPTGFYRVSNHVRHALHDSMRWASAEQAGLVPSLVVGDVSRLSQTTKDDFQTTGLTHLTAVSGTNLTLMLAFLLPLAKRIGLRRYALTATAVGAVVAFVLICRSEPSVVRAAAMGLVALSATGLAADRRRGLRHLGTAVLLLTLGSPWLAVNWGFALSVVASAAILWWGTNWQQMLRQWLPGCLAEALAIPLAAQLATQPIVTNLSGSISAVGVIANALTGAFVGPVTVLGLTAGLLGSIWPPLSYPVGYLAGWCIQPVLSIAHFLAGLPAASWKWPSDPKSLLTLTIACLVIGCLLPWLLAKSWTTILLVLALIIGSLVAPRQPGWPGEWLVVTCDVGQGDARVLRTGPHSAVLVDTGPEAKPTLDCLTSLEVRELNAVVITHIHGDHVGGLAGVLQKFPATTVITGPATPRRINSGSGPTLITHPGDRFQVGWLAWQTIAADPIPGNTGPTDMGESSIENDTGVAGVATVNGVRVLLAGDREPAGQLAILDSRADIRSEILAMPHHGSSRQVPEFFDRSGAKIVTISTGKGNSYGHPSATAIRLAEASGMRVYRTDQDGSIAIGKAPHGLTVTTQNQRSKPS